MKNNHLTIHTSEDNHQGGQRHEISAVIETDEGIIEADLLVMTNEYYAGKLHIRKSSRPLHEDIAHDLADDLITELTDCHILEVPKFNIEIDRTPIPSMELLHEAVRGIAGVFPSSFELETGYINQLKSDLLTGLSESVNDILNQKVRELYTNGQREELKHLKELIVNQLLEIQHTIDRIKEYNEK